MSCALSHRGYATSSSSLPSHTKLAMNQPLGTVSTIAVLFTSLVLLALCLFLGLHFSNSPISLSIQLAISIVMAIPMSLSLAWWYKKRGWEYWKNAQRGVVIFCDYDVCILNLQFCVRVDELRLRCSRKSAPQQGELSGSERSVIVN